MAESPLLARRSFLRGVLGGAAVAASAATVLGPSSVLAGFPLPGRRLSFHNLNTGETYTGEYWSNGHYQPEAMLEINRFLRDWRTGTVHMIDPRLLDLLHRLQQRTDGGAPFEVICGYRCPRTNAIRYSRGSGVAKNSFHMRGQAIDIRLPGISLAELHGEAVDLRGGGVGYYPRSGFIHVDVGPVRYWGASRYQSRPYNRRHPEDSPLDANDAESVFDGQESLGELQQASFEVGDTPDSSRFSGDDVTRPVIRETPRHRRHAERERQRRHHAESKGHHGKGGKGGNSPQASRRDKQRHLAEVLSRRSHKPAAANNSNRLRLQVRLPHRKPHGVG